MGEPDPMRNRIRLEAVQGANRKHGPLGTSPRGDRRRFGCSTLHAGRNLARHCALLFHRSSRRGDIFADALNGAADRFRRRDDVARDAVEALDLGGDLVGGLLGLIGQALDLGGDDGKSPARLAGPRRFDGCIEREQVDLAGDVADQFDDASWLAPHRSAAWPRYRPAQPCRRPISRSLFETGASYAAAVRRCRKFVTSCRSTAT